MKSQVLSSFDMIWMPSLVLILFVTIFAVMLFYVFNKRQSGKFKTVENLPLSEGQKYEK